MERNGRFLELPSGDEVDPVEWLRRPWSGYLAGILGYEFAWALLDVRAAMPNVRVPRLWVGRFHDAIEAPPPAPGPGVLTALSPTVRRREYEEAVRACIGEITHGELFEINYTARFRAHWNGSPRRFWDAMRAANTGDYFGYLQADEFAVASVSPEAFVTVRDGLVETRPIKGTRPRAADPSADTRARDELASSAKDRAENIMIVDLMRNDLTPVCQLGSVHVAGLCQVESFADVHHLVSTVRGRLRDGVAPIDVLLRCFPAGSITGAPKLRAIELAATYELEARGFYCGSMFVATRDALRSSVLIRTATLRAVPDGFDVDYGAGGAVVADSAPDAEWEEAMAKLRPLSRLMGHGWRLDE